jgi:hypothetical protein
MLLSTRTKTGADNPHLKHHCRLNAVAALPLRETLPLFAECRGPPCSRFGSHNVGSQGSC